MDIEKFTAKMQEAIQKASQLALSYKHQVIDIEHVLYVLLNDSSGCLLYTSPSPRDVEESRMPSSA